jgi:glycosyltransferase involved in cell wall biosynthesis
VETYQLTDSVQHRVLSPVLSIVLPAHREGAHLADSLRAIRDAAFETNASFEIIVVDDGSPDESWPLVLALGEAMPELRAVSLARNFGKESAILAGLDMALGEAVITMDCDLQHPPELIGELFARWRDGYQVVNAVKAKRPDESPIHRIGAKLFYRAFERLASAPLAGASDYKLLDREVVDVYRRLPERSTFFRGLVSWMGYRQENVPFEVAKRAGGHSSWSVGKLAKMAVEVITSFSTAPLHVVTVVGGIFLVFAGALGFQTLYRYITGGAVEGFTTVILLLLVIGAVMMMALGVIGQYIAKIYDEVKGRPRYLIKERLDWRDATGTSRPNEEITDLTAYRRHSR